jgi:hypothetical protein
MLPVSLDCFCFGFLSFVVQKNKGSKQDSQWPSIPEGVNHLLISLK